jgi:methyltransferase (TIGR00027 family)
MSRAAGTAVGPMVIAAVEQHYPDEQRLVHDELAALVIPPTMRAVVRLARWRAFREWLVKASEKQAPGVWGGIACRKRYIDEQLAEALSAGAESVVVLGAGLDTRAYRLVPRDIPVFEVDLPVNLRDKRERLDVPGTVTLVPIDFESESLGAVLAAYGYLPRTKTVFVWEGVTQYLTESAVRQTFDVLATVATGSRLLFTYVRADFLDGSNRYGSDVLYQRFVVKEPLWHFGMSPEEVGALLAEYGWRELEQVGAVEFTARYVRPTGRTTPMSELEHAVLAEKV